MSAGFTLTEMLVALMVLGVVAGTMSTTMGTAFKSYERLDDSSSDLREQNRLRQVMTEVSGHSWLADGKTKEKMLDKISVNGPYFDKLAIEESDDDIWILYAHSAEEEKTAIMQSASKLRFRAVGLRRNMSVNRTNPYDYHTLVLEQLGGEWQQIASVALKVDADPACRFDIVGRQCR